MTTYLLTEEYGWIRLIELEGMKIYGISLKKPSIACMYLTSNVIAVMKASLKE